jgi:hypothetical protein
MPDVPHGAGEFSRSRVLRANIVAGATDVRVPGCSARIFGPARREAPLLRTSLLRFCRRRDFPSGQVQP